MSKKIRSLRVPKYRHHKPSKLAVVTLRGKDFYLGRYGTKDSHEIYAWLISLYTEAIAQNLPFKMTQEDIDAHRNGRKHAASITVVEAADRYLTYVKSRNRSKPELAHVKGMLKPLVKLYENEYATEIGPAELREVQRAMVAPSNSKRKPWSRHYVNEQVGRLKRMYKWLVGEGLVPRQTLIFG